MADVQNLETIGALKAQLKALTEENAQLRYERDVARAELSGLRPVATPEQEAEFGRQVAVGDWLDFEQVASRMADELRGQHGQQ